MHIKLETVHRCGCVSTSWTSAIPLSQGEQAEYQFTHQRVPTLDPCDEHRKELRKVVMKEE